MQTLDDQFNSLRQSFGRGQRFQAPQQNWKQQMKGVDYSQFLPMGASRRLMQLTPQSIQAGARAFEADIAARAMRERQAVVQEAVRRRALAAKQLAEEQFRKVWPQGRSEELVNNFIKNKPFLRYKK